MEEQQVSRRKVFSGLFWVYLETICAQAVTFGHYKIFCVNAKYGIQYGFRIFYLIALQNEENYEREESCSA